MPWKPQQYQEYTEFINSPISDQFSRRLNIAKQLASTPTISNLYNAAGALFGAYDPQNPYLIQGAPEYLPGNVNGVKTLISKAVSKGMVKGNEVRVIPSMIEDLIENGFTVRRNTPIKNLRNPITNRAEAQAAKDFLEDQGYPWKPIISESPVEVHVQKTTLKPRVNKKYSSDAERRAAANDRSKKYYRTKVEDKTNKVKFRERKQDKLEQFNQTGDRRRLSAGYSRMDRAKTEYDWSRMENYPEFTKPVHKINVRMAKLKDSTDKAAIKKAKEDKKSLIELFRQKYVK